MGFGPQEFWDERFASEGFVYGDQPNSFLRQQSEQLSAGDALCLAEGEGRNAVFLAEQGHRVMAQDLSPVGLAKAQALAQQRGVCITSACSNLQDFHPQPSSWDLVVAIWMHLEPGLRASVFQRVITALRPGGHLLLEAYSPRQLMFSSGGPRQRDLLIEPEQLRRELTGLELLVLQEVERDVQEGATHRGRSAVVQLLGQKK